MITIFSTLVAIGILVTFHEYGHYIVAKNLNVKVLKFSIGFGKPLFSIVFGHDRTEFVIAALPLGGYVKMLDERDPETLSNASHQDLERAFNRQAIWKRMLIVIAGPMANLFLAIVIYWTLFMSGMTGLSPILGEIPKDSIAAKSGLQANDKILQVNSVPVKTWQDVNWEILNTIFDNKTMVLTVLSTDHQTHERTLHFSDVDTSSIDENTLSNAGLKPPHIDLPAIIGEVSEDGAAKRAGLRQNDRIIKVNGLVVENWEAFVEFVRASPQKELSVEILRDGSTRVIKITPDTTTDQEKTVGKIGVGPDITTLQKFTTMVSYTPTVALSKAINKTYETSVFSVKMIGNMLIGKASIKGISGPITIGNYAGQSAKMGIAPYLGFLALMSISLGVLNLLPIPVLDGGHLLYYMVELIKGSPLSDYAMEIGQRVGFSLLGLIMMCALYNDLNRLITG